MVAEEEPQVYLNLLKLYESPRKYARNTPSDTPSFASRRFDRVTHHIRNGTPERDRNGMPSTRSSAGYFVGQLVAVRDTYERACGIPIKVAKHALLYDEAGAGEERFVLK